MSLRDALMKLVPVEQPQPMQMAQAAPNFAPVRDRSQLADALLARSARPAQNWGEAVNQIASAFAGRRIMDRQQDQEQQRNSALYSALMGEQDPQKQAAIMMQAGDPSLFNTITATNLQKQLNPPDPRDSQMKDLQLRKAEMDLQPKSKLLSPDEEAQQIRLRGASRPQTTVTVGGESDDGNLRKKLAEKTGESWNELQQAATISASNAQDFQVLDELIKMAPQGPITGRLANAFPGVNAPADAFNSIVKRIAPTLRAPGSGATSDIEYEGMLRSLPALGNSPEANAMINEIMKAKAAVNIERGDIIAQYQMREISLPAAQRAIAELNKRSIMTPEMRRMMLGVGGGADGPAIGAVEDGHRFKGGDPSDPNSWEKLR